MLFAASKEFSLQAAITSSKMVDDLLSSWLSLVMSILYMLACFRPLCHIPSRTGEATRQSLSVWITPHESHSRHGSRVISAFRARVALWATSTLWQWSALRCSKQRDSRSLRLAQARVMLPSRLTMSSGGPDETTFYHFSSGLSSEEPCFRSSGFTGSLLKANRCAFALVAPFQPSNVNPL